jgi:hypothetical protein
MNEPVDGRTQQQRSGLKTGVSDGQKGDSRSKDGYDFSELLFAISCALAIVYTAVVLSSLPFKRDIAAHRDFIVYWATGQQLAHHGNPYDPVALKQIEQDGGFTGDTAYYMRNTPWALPLALPLGYMSVQAAALPWSLIMLGLLVASVRMLWNMFGPVGSRLDWLGYCFPPALACVDIGQTSVILLFGLVLFLRFHRTRPFAAGAALWLCTIKPHLFLPFALVLLAWIVVSRSYLILAGGVAAMLAGNAITACIDPSAWTQYMHYVRTSNITREFTACLGDVLRDALNPSAEWLAFVPAMLGSIWAVIYFWQRRHAWDWLENGNPVMLVSLVVAPFGWIFDQTLAIPALLFAASQTSSRVLLSVLALIYIAIEVELFRFDPHSLAYLWIVPAWLAWYLFARADSCKADAAPASAAQSIV